MQITYTKPAERGVTTLMYVGDDQSVEKATGSTPSSLELLLGAAAAYFALEARGVARVASGGYAAYTAYRLLKASR